MSNHYYKQAAQARIDLYRDAEAVTAFLEHYRYLCDCIRKLHQQSEAWLADEDGMDDMMQPVKVIEDWMTLKGIIDDQS